MQYRPEIDGLRAVAVLPVILFHAGFDAFSGGYVGVDVFFVISGYLITCILIGELESGQFSVLRFYERRARRILPALFFVILACVPFAFMWMSPAQLKDFGQSLVAVVTFASNFLFWRESGYFEAAAELKPLLHTWSLAVEEQYYLIFPLFLLAVWRFGRGRVLVLVTVIALASLLLAEWGWRNSAGANFYLPQFRAWELLAGSICAFLSVGKAQRSHDIPSVCGLLLIVIAMFLYDSTTPFPSLYALAPVIGTCLVILFADSRTLVARILSMRVFVGIGLISYSAYLWHQPLFAFARIRQLDEPGHSLMAALAVMALVLAWATWRWIEQPFRKRPDPVLATRGRVFAASGVFAAMLALTGIGMHLGQGFQWRFEGAALQFAKAETDRAARNRQCMMTPASDIRFDNPACRTASRNGAIDVLLLGDSHMLSLSDVLRSELGNLDIGHLHASYSGCVPLRGLQGFGGVADSACPEFNDRAYAFAAQQNISTIVLAARFSWYLAGAQFDNTEGGIEPGQAAWVDVAGADGDIDDDTARRARVLAAFDSEVRKLAERFNVVLVHPVPEAGWDVPLRGLKLQYVEDGTTDISTSADVYQQRAGQVNALFDALSDALENVVSVRPYDVLCSDETGRCRHADAAGVYYFDTNHLSNAGARLVAPLVVDAIEGIAR